MKIPSASESLKFLLATAACNEEEEEEGRREWAEKSLLLWNSFILVFI
jgi:hypothetical protein